VGTTSAAQAVTLTNSGHGSLSITSIAASGDFAQTNNCSSSLAANGTCTVSATFTPTAGATRTGTLTVTDNASNGPQTASLTGTALDLTITAGQANLTVTRGQSAQTTLTVTPVPLAGFSPTVTFACSGLPAESNCSAPSVSPNGAAATAMVTIQTTAPSARLDHLFGRGEVFYALLLPGWVGFVLLVGNGKGMSRGMRTLGFAGMLMLSTIGLTSCGNSRSSGGTAAGGNPGTPTGTSAVTVTATTSGAAPITKQVKIMLTVQ